MPDADRTIEERQIEADGKNWTVPAWLADEIETPGARYRFDRITMRHWTQDEALWAEANIEQAQYAVWDATTFLHRVQREAVR